MIKAPINLQDLRREIYIKAKAEPTWQFWGLYVHVCKMDTLREAYRLAKQNDGAPGIDGVTFEAIEAGGLEEFLAQIREELLARTYRPTRHRHVEIPKEGGKGVRVLSIPTIRDRVVQGALKLILEPIFEADFQPGSYGYRPKRQAQEAVQRVAEAIVQHKTRVLDVDLCAFFDNIRHHLVVEKVAQRVNDTDIMHLLKLILKASGKKGVAQGGVLSPLLSNLYLNEVDRMLERAKEVTRSGKYTYLEYARFADDRAPRSCTRDEGRPLGAALQEEAPNHLKLLRPKAVVVSVKEKAGKTCQVSLKKTNASEPLRKGRKRRDEVKTGGESLTRDKPRGNLLTAWAASGLKVA